MLPTTRDVRVQQWRERFERFEDSKMTVRQFCLDESVSQPSFYYWKKQVPRRKRARAENTQQGSRFTPVFEPVHVTPASTSLHRTTIRLGDEVAIELGEDLQVVELIVQAVCKLSLQRRTTEAGGVTC